jgi:hypothetical protein
VEQPERRSPHAVSLQLRSSTQGSDPAAASRAVGRAPAVASSRRRRSRTRRGAADGPGSGVGRGRAPAQPSRGTAGRRRRSRSAAATALTRRRAASARSSRPTPRSGLARRPAGAAQSAKSGRAAARAWPAARRRAPSARPPAPVGKRRGRPARSRSSRPASRCSKKRFRQRPTTRAAVSSRRAISTLLCPWAAYSTIFAAHHHLVRQRVTRDPMLQLRPLRTAQHDQIPARPRHADTIRRGSAGPFTDSGPNLHRCTSCPRWSFRRRWKRCCACRSASPSNRFLLANLAARVGMLPMEPGSRVMERKMLRGIKERAERITSATPARPISGAKASVGGRE